MIHEAEAAARLVSIKTKNDRPSIWASLKCNSFQKDPQVAMCVGDYLDDSRGETKLPPPPEAEI